jgi:hypothetical protein
MADQLLLTFSDTATTEVYYRFETDKILVYVNGTLANFGVDTNPDPGAQLYWYCIGTVKRTFVGQANYPYAYKLDDLNAVECQIPLCDLHIAIPIITTNATSAIAADGTATINYTGTVSDPSVLRYRLNDGEWQTSNVLTGLAPGTYTAWIKSSDSCIDSATFVIENENAYGERYYIDYDDVDGTPLALKIYEKDYTGPREKVNGGPSPITIEYSEGEKYDIAKGSKATITLESDTRMKYIGFFSSDERQFRVDHLVNGVIAWRGYGL